MFLVVLIMLLALMVVSTTKIVKRRQTDDFTWGEPAVTVIQIVLVVAMVVCMII